MSGSVKDRFSILFVPSGGRISPASRYRIYQLIPFLEKEGIKCRVYSIISEGTSRDMINSPLFNRPKRIFYYIRVVLEKFARAWNVILSADKFDLIFTQMVFFPDIFRVSRRAES